MNNSIISSRYAKALFLVGVEQKCLEALQEDMELLASTIREIPDFSRVLSNPVVRLSEKINVMHALLEKRVHQITLGFVDTLIKNKREIMMPDVVRRFIGLYESSKGIKRAHVKSAIHLDETTKTNLQQQLNLLFKADVHMSTEVDTELIGGFVLRMGDLQYDASLSTALKRMKETLKSEN